jgi:hypothetical protein
MSDLNEPYRVRSPETWQAAREAYLAGEPAEAVCERFDLGLSAFRKRAREDGWRRADQPDPPPDAPFEEDDETLDPSDLADLAWRRLTRAVSLGRSAEASRWLKLHTELTAPERARRREAARAEAAQARDADDADVRAITHVARHLALDPHLLRSPPVGPGPGEVHDVHPVHGVSPHRPANRAERRRLAQKARAGPAP